MAKSIPSFLKLHVERLPQPLPPLADGTSAVEQFCRAFRETTGWALRYQTRKGTSGRAVWSRKILGGSPAASGLLLLEKAVETAGDAPAELLDNRPVDAGAAQGLADAFGTVLTELERTRHALWQREAELAAGVPVSVRENEQHLAVRLEAVLRGAAQAIDCQAAGLYLLNEATSELKLRACIGLPKERLLEPARPLRGALADLEALIGHAVALEDVAALPHWKTPEDYPSAVCVPVSSATTPLGTLWVFSKRRRDFTPEQTNLLEIVAGRISSDLEREMLVRAGTDSRQQSRDLEAAAEWQQNRLPHAPPLCDDWQLAGWTSRNEKPGCVFHDWFTLANGLPVVLLGGVTGSNLPGALSAATVQAGARSHAVHLADPGEIVTQVDEAFTANSLGDERATLFFGRLEDSGRLHYAAGGSLSGWLVRDSGCQPLAGIGPHLGGEHESILAETAALAPHDALVVIAHNSGNKGEPALPWNLICESLADRRRLSAAVMLDAVRAALASQTRPLAGEVSLLVVKRRA